MGLLLKAQGELDAARELLQEALDATRESVGWTTRQDGRSTQPHKLLALATPLSNLGAVVLAQGELGAARKLYEEALAVRRAALGNRHVDTVASMVSLASVLSELDEGVTSESRTRAHRAHMRRPLEKDRYNPAVVIALSLCGRWRRRRCSTRRARRSPGSTRRQVRTG